MGYITKGGIEAKSSKTKLFVSLVLGILFLTIAVVIIIVDPLMLIVKYYARVAYGSIVHEALSKETDSIHLTTYLFNITNAERFLSGEDDKLKVQEVGPFTYQENRTNEDLEIDNEAGVIRYTPRHRVTFLPDESVGNPEDMIVTMPNIAMLAMASTASTYGYFTKMGLNLLAAQFHSNATVTMSAYDYLWGYDEPLIKFGNRFLPGWINFERLGLLDRLYDEKPIRLEVSSRDHDKFMVKTVNGLGGLKQWGYEDPETRNYCSSFEDTYEGIGYPPGIKSDFAIKIYRDVLCRVMPLDYQGTKTTNFGVEGLFYKISNRTFRMTPEHQCLCHKTTCMEGISDLSPCFYGLPVVLSNAHFLGTNPAIHKRVEGMNPNEEQHGSEFTIDPIIGMVMTTKFSIQVNVMVNDVEFNSKIKRFSNMLVPVVNIKIVQPKLPDDQISTLRLTNIYSPYIILVVQIVLILAGLLLLAHAARLLYWNWLYTRKRVIADLLQTKNAKEPLMR